MRAVLNSLHLFHPLLLSAVLFARPLLSCSLCSRHTLMSASLQERVEVYRIVLYSPAYFTACAIGGALSCGITHTLLTPIDLVKCNKQANPHLFNRPTTAALRDIYGGALEPVGFDAGMGGMFRGWSATLAGYSVQGAFKFGLYEWYSTKGTQPAQRHGWAWHRRELPCG